jgi:hypothetical protein
MLAPPSTPASLRHSFPQLFSTPSAISLLRETPAKSATDLFASQLAPALFNLQLSTVISPSSKSHRITSFADHHHLTLIESDSYKKQGRGCISEPPNPPEQFLIFPQRVNIRHTPTPVTCFTFRRLLHESLDTRVGGTRVQDSSALRSVSSAFNCQSSTIDDLLLPCPPHSGANHA